MHDEKIILFGATWNVGSYVLKYALEYFDLKQYEIVASGCRGTNSFALMGFYIIKWISLERKTFLLAERKCVCSYTAFGTNLFLYGGILTRKVYTNNYRRVSSARAPFKNCLLSGQKGRRRLFDQC